MLPTSACIHIEKCFIQLMTLQQQIIYFTNRDRDTVHRYKCVEIDIKSILYKPNLTYPDLTYPNLTA